jgi:type I restriction enzyme, R subunit
VASEDGTANFLTTHYPEDYFSHIVIDECHRSAWGKWSQVLSRNPGAVQIGLTATPRQIVISERSREADEDARIAADNIRHFGEPVYEYDMAQGIEDGYLAACEIVRRDVVLDGYAEKRGVKREGLEGKTLIDAQTGEILSADQARAFYSTLDFEAWLIIPERVEQMCRDLFAHLLAHGGPEQKTIVFCARDAHADAVATVMNNLYAAWCQREGRSRLEPYAFKCTAASNGGSYLPDFRGGERHHFVATTVDLLTTGVDAMPASA